MGVRLFIGGHAWTLAGEPVDLLGDRCWTAACELPPRPLDPDGVECLLDSGAFSDAPEDRLSPAAALDRQLRWEARAAVSWGAAWRSYAIVSYDRLIDEVWVDGQRVKRRWGVGEAEAAVTETVDAAAYLASRRRVLSPRHLVLSCQGVDAVQYAGCVERVLAHAEPGDWIGLGGWCILGRFTSWVPEFWRTLHLVIPAIADAGIGHVHIFGVLYLRALGGLLWMADRYGLSVSTDSTAPLLACSRGDAKKAGVRRVGWRENVAWWKRELTELRNTPYYRAPSVQPRQTLLFGGNYT